MKDMNILRVDYKLCTAVCQHRKYQLILSKSHLILFWTCVSSFELPVQQKTGARPAPVFFVCV